MYIYTITIYLQDYCAYLEIFKKIDGGGGGFGLKFVKLSTFCILEDYIWAGVVACVAYEYWHAVMHLENIAAGYIYYLYDLNYFLSNREEQ